MFPRMKAAAVSEAVWRERVKTWKASGQSAAEFVRGRGFAASTLRTWASRVAPPAGSPFVRLVPKAAATVAPTGLVVEVGGARVRVAPGFDPALLVAIVQALGGASR